MFSLLNLNEFSDANFINLIFVIINKMDYGSEIAKAGLEIKAIKLRPEDPFTWASGFRMPIYNDNRMFLFDPSATLANHFKRVGWHPYHIACM